MYTFAVEVLCGETWVRTATMETQKQAEFLVAEFEKVGQQARWLTLRAIDGLWVLPKSDDESAPATTRRR